MTAPAMVTQRDINDLGRDPSGQALAVPVEPASGLAPSGFDPSRGLVLSLFPGIGLLDAAFEMEGFAVVRGPDLLWGGDVCEFHPPAGRFDGIIGGPPCQSWSGLGNVNRARWGDQCMMPDRIPEFARCVNEAQPLWYLMENVSAAPAPETPGYEITQRIWNNRWSGGEQNRERRFTFGSRVPTAPFRMAPVAVEAVEYRPAVISTGQAGKGGARASIASMARDQGIDPARFDNSPFSVTELRRAIANGVPLPMGRSVAKAVASAIEAPSGDETANAGSAVGESAVAKPDAQGPVA